MKTKLAQVEVIFVCIIILIVGVIAIALTPASKPPSPDGFGNYDLPKIGDEVILLVNKKQYKVASLMNPNSDGHIASLINEEGQSIIVSIKDIRKVNKVEK
jgi:hypothetical protein